MKAKEVKMHTTHIYTKLIAFFYFLFNGTNKCKPLDITTKELPLEAPAIELI